MPRSITTSLDGQWAVVREGRQVLLFAGAGGPAVAVLVLDTDDAQLGFVGPPATLVLATADGVALFRPPNLEPIARLELAAPARLAAITGPRFVLVGDGKVTIVRTAERAVATQTIDVGGPIEFAVGLERNQVLFALPRQLVVWDAATARPSAKLQLQLPAPPRAVGAAAGHLWAVHKDARELYVYRLSDGRPFQHALGATIESIVSHAASPLLVVATEHGLVRLHCFAHSVTVIDGAPWQRGMPLAQLVVGEAITLLGLPPDASEPWRLSLVGAPAEVKPAEPEPVVRPAVPAVAPTERWREPLVAYAQDLVRGVDSEPPGLVPHATLVVLAERLGLPPGARRALTALYALHLIGEPAVPIARLARIADWDEALGGGVLTALAMLRRKHGRVALRTAVTDLLDGAQPRAIRLVGDGATEPRAGAFRVSRDGRADAEIEAALAAQLGRIAVVTGSLRAGLLEARLHGATAITFASPGERPQPWPRDAGLVLVLYGAASSWVADLPAL